MNLRGNRIYQIGGTELLFEDSCGSRELNGGMLAKMIEMNVNLGAAKTYRRGRQGGTRGQKNERE